MRTLKKRHARRLAAVGVAIVILVAPSRMRAQSVRDHSENSKWTLGVTTTYDDNVFKLRQGEQQQLNDGGSRYADMLRPYDFVNSIWLQGVFDGPRLFARAMELGAGAQLDVYSFSDRRTTAAIDAFAAQKLSKRDRVRAQVALTPKEFRRNYLSGSDAAGMPVYEAGIASTLAGSVQYERKLLSGKRGAPELGAYAGVVAARRSYDEMSWRDRREIGGRVGAKVEIGRLDLQARGTRVYASHNAEAEPVLTPSGMTTQQLQRNFSESEVALESSLRLAKRTHFAARYEWRVRDFDAQLGEDAVYGGRQDTRSTVRGEFRYGFTKRVRLLLGGKYETQSTYRPARGDTGDEADYTRFASFLGLEYRR